MAGANGKTGAQVGAGRDHAELGRPGPRLCVFLLQLGAPDNLAGIEPFLRNLLEDVLPVPALVRRPLARWIARRRTPQVAPLYAHLGGGSPLLANTAAQAEALADELARRGLEAKVLVCMRYAPPRAHDALALARHTHGDAAWVALPLYPHYSFSTTRSSLDELASLCTPAERARLAVIQDYPMDSGYLAAMRACVIEGIGRFTTGEQSQLHLLFSAHGLPVKMVEAGDPYPRQVQATVDGILEALDTKLPSHLAFQSRVGPTRWLEPETAAVVRELGAAGVKNLLVVPVSFVSEHLETLHELDVQLAATARAAGITRFERARTPGTSPAFITALAGLVVAARRLTLGAVANG